MKREDGQTERKKALDVVENVEENQTAKMKWTKG